MRIDGIHVESFADGEYGERRFDGLDGESLLIVGGNRTGKTLTFNTLLYNLLGARETLGLSTGRGNSVELQFSDGSTFHRGEAGTTLTDESGEHTGESAKDKLSEKLQDKQVIKNHFVHSHIGKLPLDNLSKTNLISLIRRVTNKDVEQQIQRLDRVVDQLEELTVDTKDELRRLDEDVADVERQIRDVESQLEKHENLLERIGSGDIERMSEQLLADEELEQRLDRLFSQKEGIRQRLRKLHRQKRKHENYAEEVNTVIAEAVNDFVCPTCDRRISTDKAERRLQQGVCPYCGREHSLSDMKEQIDDKIDKSDDIIQELESEIEELNEERDRLEEEIEAIQDERPELVNLDGFVKRKLRDHDHNIEALRTEVANEVKSLQGSLDELKQQREECEDEHSKLEDRLEEYEKSLAHASNRLESLREESFQADIEGFADRWESAYGEMSTELQLEIEVREDGVVRFPGRNSVREYGRGNLSGAEARLLNLSFVYTLHQFAAENDLISWDTLVFDEPFNNLDSEIREEAVEFLKDIDQQLILTTSTNELEKHFGQVEIVERDPIQTEISDFL